MPRLLSLVASVVIAFSIRAQNIELYPYLGLQGNSLFNRVITDTKDGGYLIGSSLDFVNNHFVGNLARIDNNGNLAAGFAHVVVNDQILRILELDNGNILLGGEFTTVNGVETGPLAMLKSDGTLETSFAHFPPDYIGKQWINDIVIQQTGKIVVSGAFDITSETNGARYLGLIRLNTDGTVDNSFTPHVSGYLTAIEKDDNDNIWSAGWQDVYKTDKDGNLSDGFPVHVTGQLYVGELTVTQNRGGVAGDFTSIGGVARAGVAVINGDGSIGSFAIPGGYGQYLRSRANGDIIVRSSSPLNIYNSDGVFLKTLSPGGIIEPFVDRQQRIVIMDGDFTFQRPMMRYNADLSVDATFTCSIGNISDTHSMLPFTDGRMMIFQAEPPLNKTIVYTVSRTGQIQSTPQSLDGVIRKVEGDENGFYSLRTMEGNLYKHDQKGNVLKVIPLASFSSELTNMRRHGDYLYIYGLFGAGYGHNSPGVVRLSYVDGSIDYQFVSKLQSAEIEAFDIQPDGKIVIAGYLAVNGQIYHVLRLKTNGDIDPDFTPGVCQFFGGSRTIEDDGAIRVDKETGDIYVHGAFWNYNNSGLNYVVKLNSHGEIIKSFAPSMPSEFSLGMRQGVEVLSTNAILFTAASDFQKTCAFVVDATGAPLSMPIASSFGANSGIYEMRFDGNTLFVKGRMFPPTHSSIAHNARAIFKAVNGEFAGLVATLADGEVNVSWNKTPDNATHTIIYRAIGNNTTFLAVDTVNSTIQYFVDKSPGNVNSYKLLAYNSNSDKWSNQVMAASPFLTLPATEIDTVSFVANWTTAGANTTAVLEISTDNFATVASSFPASSTPRKVTGLEAFRDYQYRVKFQTSNGEIISDTAFVTTLPLAPAILGWTATPSTLKLEWSNRFDQASETIVERAVNKDGPFTNLKSLSPTAVLYIDSTVTAATTYYYRLVARNQDISSLYTKSIAATTLPKYQQVISFDSIPAQAIGATVTLNASTTSGLPITFEIFNPTIGKLSGSQLVAEAAGSTTVHAKQSGNKNYNAADATRTFLVNKHSQSIAFALPKASTFGSPPLSLSATATSGLPVSFTVNDNSVASVSGNILTLKKAGKIAVTASQSGNSFYLPATKTDTLVIERATQSITFSFPDTVNAVPSVRTLSMTASSGLPVTYGVSDPTIASITGNIMTYLKAGTVTLKASQTGNENFLAVSVSKSFVIRKNLQTIDFVLPEQLDATVPPIKLKASSSSGNPASFTVNDATVGSLDGDLLTIRKGGVLVVTASQAGNNYYHPASKSQTVRIVKVSQSISLGLPDYIDLSTQLLSVPQVTSAGLPVTYQVSNNSFVEVQDGSLKLLTAGTVMITALNSGNDKYQPVQVQHTLTISKASQRITIAPLPDEIDLNTSFLELIASTSSGLPVSFSVSHPQIASIVDNQLILHQPGVVEITIVQAGNNRYLAAEPVTVRIKINNNSIAPVLYPIPSDGVFTVPEIIHPCIDRYNILNSKGIIIAGGTVDQLKSAGIIDLTGYESGIYFVQFTGCKEIVTVRLLKK